MDEQQRIKCLQRSWAASKGLKFDSEGYLPDVESNLRTPLSPCARADFSKGAGSELARNMRALHSSSALVANYFDFWTNRDKGPLLAALGVDEERVESLRFERRFPTGLRGTPPHADVTLALAVGRVVAIESKFTEHLSLSRRGRNNFAPAYFPWSNRLWTRAGLPKCQELAEALEAEDVRYHALDACQLLKHALGLATVLGDRFSLYYLFYDSHGDRSNQHKEELRSFASHVAEEIRFTPVTYQQAYGRLLDAKMEDADYRDYRDYLGFRYFPEIQKDGKNVLITGL